MYLRFGKVSVTLHAPGAQRDDSLFTKPPDVSDGRDGISLPHYATRPHPYKPYQGISQLLSANTKVIVHTCTTGGNRKQTNILLFSISFSAMHDESITPFVHSVHIGMSFSHTPPDGYVTHTFPSTLSMYGVFVHTYKNHTPQKSRRNHRDPYPQNTTLTCTVCICVSVKFRSALPAAGHCFALASGVMSLTNQPGGQSCSCVCMCARAHQAVLEHAHDATTESHLMQLTERIVDSTLV